MTLVTSFSPKGYAAYGKAMLESAVVYFPGKVIAYYDEEPTEKVEFVEYRDITKTHGFAPFMSYMDRSPIYSGNTPAGYNYNFDAKKFSKKVFAQLDVLKRSTGKVFWFDADTVINKPIPKEFLESIFEKAALVYPGREGFYTETGFLGFDTDKHDFPKFLEKYTECYQKGKLFNLPRWHDCEAFDWARKESGVSAKNLSPEWKEGDDLDVIPTTVLSEYLVHMKGNLKWKPKDSALN